MSAIKIVEKSHARLSPSATKRWMTCPGSVGFLESLNLPYKTSRHAAEGTVAHEVHEKALLSGDDAEDYIGQKMVAGGFTFTVTEEMAEAVQLSLDYIRGRIKYFQDKGLRVVLEVEVKASLKYLDIPGLDGGTSDVVLLVWKGTKLLLVEVIDYKHGAGVVVEAKGNTQALCYGLGTINPYLRAVQKSTKIIITISQPRARSYEGPIRSWETNYIDLIKWQDEDLVPAAKLTLKEDAPLVPSDDACRFCDAAGQCPALFKTTQELAIADFKEDTFPSPLSMSAEQKKTILAHADMIRSFISAVEDQVKTELDGGSTEYSDSYKLVHKKVNRRLTEEATDEDFSPLLDYLKIEELYEYEIKFASLGSIEKSLKKHMKPKEVKTLMGTLTWKPEPETAVVPLGDKRSAVQPSVITDFKDLD